MLFIDIISGVNNLCGHHDHLLIVIHSQISAVLEAYRGTGRELITGQLRVPTSAL